MILYGRKRHFRQHIRQCVPDGVGGIDTTCSESVVVVTSHGVNDLTFHGLTERQQSSGMRVDHSEHLVHGGREASRALSVVIVKLREYLHPTQNNHLAVGLGLYSSHRSITS